MVPNSRLERFMKLLVPVLNTDTFFMVKGMSFFPRVHIYVQSYVKLMMLPKMSINLAISKILKCSLGKTL